MFRSREFVLSHASRFLLIFVPLLSSGSLSFSQQNWPVGVPYPSIYPAWPNPDVTVIGIGTLASPCISQWVDNQFAATETVYEFSYAFESKVDSQTPFRLHIDLVHTCSICKKDSVLGDLKSSIQGFEGHEVYRSRTLSNGVGEIKQNVSSHLLDYNLVPLPGGKREAVEVQQDCRYGSGALVYGTSVNLSSSFTSGPSATRQNAPAIFSSINFGFSYDQDDWEVVRSSNAVQPLTSSGIWAHSGNPTGSDVITSASFGNFEQTLHLFDVAVLNETSAGSLTSYMDCLVPLWFWSLPDQYYGFEFFL